MEDDNSADFTPDPEHALAAPDQNFAAGDSLTFLGEPLKGFSIRRQFAAQACGNRLLCGRAQLDRVPCTCGGNEPTCELCGGTGERSGAYDGMFIDVAVLIYLCRCPLSEVQLASRRPNTVVDNALAWAEEAGMNIGSEVFNEACQIYAAIMQQLQDAQFKVTKVREGAGAKNA
jgi:hypothetical protein